MAAVSRVRKAIRHPGLAWQYVRSHTPAILAYHLLGRTGYAFAPLRIAVAVNSICNMRCIMCDIGQHKSELHYYHNIEGGGELALEDFQALLDQVRRFRPVIAINLTEPLLRKDIERFVEEVTNRKLECELGTNGYLLESFAQGLVEGKLSRLYVSIDGHEAVHDQIRGVEGAFKRACNGIQHVLELRRSLRLTTPKVYVAYCINNANSHCIADTAEIMKRMGVDGVVFTHLDFITESMADGHNQSFSDQFGEVRCSGVSVLDPAKMDVSSLEEQIGYTRDKYSAFVAFSPPGLRTAEQLRRYYATDDHMLATRCHIPWINCQVRSNGDVVAGSRCFNVIIGNLHDSTFPQVWNGAEFRRFRKALARSGTTPACAICCGIFS